MNNQEELICSICYSRIRFQGLISSCQHKYCSKCILNWAKVQNSCPICKRKFKQIKQVYRTVNPFEPKVMQIYKRCRDVLYKVMNKSQSSPVLRPPKVIQRPVDRNIKIFYQEEDNQE